MWQYNSSTLEELTHTVWVNDLQYYVEKKEKKEKKNFNQGN